MRSCSRFVTAANWLTRPLAITCLSAGILLTQGAQATTVQFQTVMGDFEVNLFDKTTPKTVANFLAYVGANDYRNTLIHRSEPGFVIQGGGFTFNGATPLVSIPQKPAVENEPVYSNLRGTIAMAKLPNRVNSATNQWFINLANNSANLDKQNGGFTVFGQVVGNGMAVVDSIAALNRFKVDVLDGFPLRNYTTADGTANKPINDHLVLIQNIVVLNADPDTAANLNPAKTTLVAEKEDSGGGSIGLLGLLMLSVLALGRKRLLNRA